MLFYQLFRRIFRDCRAQTRSLPPSFDHLGCLRLPRRNLYNTRLFISNKTVDRHKSQRSISKQPSKISSTTISAF
ncbi:Uncharacterized protein APZ42_031759 [Daphnia magna]|uniref:Uncharacterized protein n=1 Tax=Daphnia magna TaxID=35525 RepID=A0A164MM07_9CRUS|nr:Uncharacterized protein APZ42_031759 [Daphnia magna]